MFDSTFSNGRALTTLKLRKEHLIIDDKLVLGAFCPQFTLQRACGWL